MCLDSGVSHHLDSVYEQAVGKSIHLGKSDRPTGCSVWLSFMTEPLGCLREAILSLALLNKKFSIFCVKSENYGLILSIWSQDFYLHGNIF